jgi:hypothetical protein
MTTITITKYKILTNGSDGGHRYISSSIDYKGQHRNITILFASKEDEQKLTTEQHLTIKGELMDEGPQQSLMLLESTLL